MCGSIKRGFHYTFYKWPIDSWKHKSLNSEVKLWIFYWKELVASNAHNVTNNLARFSTPDSKHEADVRTISQKAVQQRMHPNPPFRFPKQPCEIVLWSFLPHCFFFYLQCFDQPKLPHFVRIVEVGPRDGLQNEKVENSLFISVSSMRYIPLLCPLSYKK